MYSGSFRSVLFKNTINHQTENFTKLFTKVIFLYDSVLLSESFFLRKNSIHNNLVIRYGSFGL